MKHSMTFLVVDDHPVFRKGLVALVESDSHYTVINEVGSVAEAVEALEKQIPDIALVDISLAGQSGLSLVKTIKASYPRVIVLIISMHDEAVYAERALKAGAKGYVMKHEAASVMKEAIMTVLSGKIYLSSMMRDSLVESMFMPRVKEQLPTKAQLPTVERLSDRELDVLELIGQGYGAGEIADMLNLSAKTVNTYRDNIKEKLNIPNAGELRRFAIKWEHSMNR
jgi:DNA-binding NarL/FixJ family response regulator